MATPRFELSVDQRQLVALKIAMKEEIDGVRLKRELVGAFNVALEPGISHVKTRLATIPHYGGPVPKSDEDRTPLATYITPRIKASVRLGGRSVGVSVRIPQTPKLRKFAIGARWLNRPKWSHPVFGREGTAWVEQISPIPDYFDEAFREDHEMYRLACIKAVNWMFERIAMRASLK